MAILVTVRDFYPGVDLKFGNAITLENIKGLRELLWATRWYIIENVEGKRISRPLNLTQWSEIMTCSVTKHWNIQELDGQEEEIRTIQLLQKKKREFGIIHGYGAKVVRTLTISRCDGVTVTHEWTQTILDLDKREVLQIYKTHLFRDDIMAQRGHSYIAVELKGTTYKTRNLIGWTSGNGYCGGQEFSEMA